MRYSILSIILFVFCLADEKNTKKPVQLFQKLKSNEGWIERKNKEGIIISTKAIEGMSIGAFMVQQKTNINPTIIKNIIMDIKNYDTYFSNSETSNFKEIYRKNNWVDGYHFIPVTVPLIKDREYYFRIQEDGFIAEDSSSIVHWYLVRKNDNTKSVKRKITNDIITINYGAGLWSAEDFEGDSYVLTYRLFLDPGGMIPGFMTNMMNETNIVNIFKDVISAAEYKGISFLR